MKSNTQTVFFIFVRPSDTEFISDKQKERSEDRSLKKEGVGIALFSRAASSQVSSAPVSLTTVFGMGTGGSSPSLTPTLPFIQDAYTPYIPPVKAYLQNRITHPIQVTRKNSSSFSILHSRYALNLLLWSSPRPISISQLNTSRHLHL